jgi:hypothetical protein
MQHALFKMWSQPGELGYSATYEPIGRKNSS